MTHCIDCGERGQREGHQTCQYPGLKLAARKPRKAGR